MEETNDEKTIRVITFSGKKTEWPIWEEKFLARAARKKYKDVLLGKVEIPKSTDDLTTSNTENKKKLKVRELNELAYQDLILSIDGTTKAGRVAFQIVKMSKVKDYEDGNAALAWERLKKKYAPTRAPSLLMLKKKFAQSQLKDKDSDPDEWITELEDMRAQLAEMKMEMSDDDFIIHVLGNLPDEYEIDVSKLEDRIGKDLTIDDVREALNLRFEKMNKGKGADDDDTDDEDEGKKEKALIARQFKGKCRECGKYGHKAADCRSKNKQNGNSNNSGRNNGQKTRFNGKCNYCHKFGHKKADCFKRKKDEGEETKQTGETANQSTEVAEMVFMSKEEIIPVKNDKFSKNTCLGDTGATTHMFNKDDGMFDVKEVRIPIKIGNGRALMATKKGKMRAKIIQKDGTEKIAILENVYYVPELWTNLFSINSAIKKGFKIGNEGFYLTLTKGNFKITFDRVMHTENGFVVGIDIIPIVDESANTVLSRGAKIHIQKLHEILGHASEDVVRKTAGYYGWDIFGKFEKCENCAISKAKQKGVNKESKVRSSTPGERLYFDISSVRKPSISKSKFWLLVVDDATDMCWSYFLKKKSELSEKMIKLIKEINGMEGRQVKFVRCDNAGENIGFQDECKKEGLKLEFEFTAPNTPQQNGKVERKFATLYGKVRSMLNRARLPERWRTGVWAEAASTATFNENLILSKEKTKPSYELFYGKEHPHGRNLRMFGEMGVVKLQRKIKGKLVNRGASCMFVGYSNDHPSDVFRMFDFHTQRIKTSRDIEWLGKSYGELKGISKVHVVKVTNDEDSEGEFDREVQGDDLSQCNGLNQDQNSNNDTNREQTDEPRLSARTIRELRQLTGWLNPEAEKMVQEWENNQPNNETADIACPVMDIGEIETNLSSQDDAVAYDEPENFREAWDHPDPMQRTKWRDAIRKELGDMNKRGVWRKIKRCDVPKDRRCVKCKWVFKVKRNGVFRARLVACGYSQVAGVDFTENYAPVINDITFRILLIAMIVWKLEGKIIDVETAFLNGDLDEDIYMDCPEGLDAEDDECLQLQRTIYGLVQAARQYFKKFVGGLKQIGFEGGQVDPCLLMKENNGERIYIGTYVDDNACIGTQSLINETIEELQKLGFKLKVMDDFTDYLSCEIIFSKDKTKAWLGQPHLLKKLEKTFGELTKGLSSYKTPGTPGHNVTRPTTNSERISAEEQKLYRSGVGMLLYLVKYSRPDIANAVRELSKSMDGATRGSYREMLRVVKFVLETKNKGLRIEPKRKIDEWDLITLSDSDYAGDQENRISVSGFILYLMGVAISWRSKGQRSVTLSSSEAEYVALSEAAKEIKFVVQILQSMKIPVKIPVVVRVDNVGAIFMTENVTTSNRTRHVDIRYHFVREFVEDGFIKIVFVKTADNDADLFTKNVNAETYQRHATKFLSDREKFN